METLRNLKPTKKPTVMELVKRAGIDVSDWANAKGGAEGASRNPKYCYEWCFQSERVSILDLWFDNMDADECGIFQELNPLEIMKSEVGQRKRRAQSFYDVSKLAFQEIRDLRVIILDRKKGGEGNTSARMLDHSAWSVVQCDASGKILVRRGTNQSRTMSENSDPEILSFTEGEQRLAFVKHRKREWRLRQAKLDAFKTLNGRVFCEVPTCGFDFGKVYGALGEGFAEVHHLDQLSAAPLIGRKITLDDLAVVCSNCHRMIHSGGACRTLAEIIVAK